MNLVTAMLIKKVRFLDFNGNWVELYPETEVMLDVFEGIACFQDVCFDIAYDEYSVLN